MKNPIINDHQSSFLFHFLFNKTSFIMLILSFYISSFLFCYKRKNPLETDTNIVAPVYVSIVLHYEESFVQSKPYFFQQRNILLSLARYLREQDITLNVQPDWAFMAAVQSFEDSLMRVETNGKNILRYLKEELNHEIDPHAHEHGWNYADVAYLINQLGVTPSHIAGGLIADPPEDSKYTYLLSPIAASHFIYSWQAEWLWGDATANHTHDTAASGIWRPKNQTHFYEHDDHGPIPCIGKYTNDMKGVYELIEKSANGLFEADDMITAAIFIGQGNVDSLHQELAEHMSTLKTYEAEGQLVFVSLKNAGEIWQTEYSGKGYLYIKQ